MSETGHTLIIKRTFSGLDKETLDILRNVARRQTYQPQTVLCRQGQVEHTFYIIVDGRVSVTQRIDAGEERSLQMLGPREFFGEMSLIDDSPRMATCTTLTEATVLEVTEEVFDRMVETSPTIAFRVLQKLLANTRDMDQRSIASLQEKNKALEEAYLALQAAQVELVKKERLEQEIELAAKVQRDLLPKDLPQFPDYTFASYLAPARHVGGDFYDVIQLGEEHVGLLLADVADKGFHAALFMAVTRTLFHQESQRSLSPAKVATAVHQAMLSLSPDSEVFVTAFYGVLHRPTGRLKYVRAGQERPLRFRPHADIPVKELPGNGRFLGMIEQLHLEEYTVQIQPGDRLVLFSDGVPDAANPAGKQFGYERLQAVLQQHGRAPAQTLVQKIANAAAHWSQNAAAFDDLTLLVMEAVANES
ncbi:MAG: PP2C family protein-serine/threonine phosphatase [Anaerolineae bacterium]